MQEIISSLLDYARKLNMGIVYTNTLSNHTQSFADIQSHAIIINANWYRPSQLPFIIAHEISHLLQCTSGDAKLSATTLLNEQYEKEADHHAISMLVPFYMNGKDVEQVNLNDFMALFDLPARLEDVCYDELGKCVN